MFVSPAEKVYGGMVVGISSKGDDIVVNVCKKKHLTAIRSAGADEALKLTPPRKLSLEEALEFINDDELVEITPHSIRLRKRYLKDFERKRAARAVQNEFGEKDE